MFQVVHTNGRKLQDNFLGKLYISNNTSTNPEMLNNTMVYNLEVNGSTKIIGDIRFSGEYIKIMFYLQGEVIGSKVEII